MRFASFLHAPSMYVPTIVTDLAAFYEKAITQDERSDGECLTDALADLREVFLTQNIIPITTIYSKRNAASDAPTLSAYLYKYLKITPSLRLLDMRTQPFAQFEVERHETNYSLEVMTTEPDDDGEGDEDNEMYTFDTIEELAAFVFPTA